MKNEIYQGIADKLEDKSPMKAVFGFIADSDTVATKADEIRDLQVEQLKLNLEADGVKRQSMKDCRDRLNLITDSFFNHANGVGTEFDPGAYNDATIPMSISPNEATAYYSSGGIAAKLIDKKSYGLFQNGYSFAGTGWDESEISQLVDYAESIGFSQAAGDSVRDGLIYGGALLIPDIKGDDPTKYRTDVSRLKLEKDFISHFWTADRWNAVLIPNYNISELSYLTPSEFFVPIAGLGVNSSRLAVIRPKKLPYWGTIRQMGWGVSEFESWAASLMGYEIMAEAVATMYQQLNLMYHSIPMDNMIAQNGVAAVQEFARFNSEQMNKWSVVKSRTMNVVGKIETIQRTYTGMIDLMTAKRQDVAAKSDIPESVIWHTNPQGMASDRKDDVTLKQGETLNRISSIVGPQFKNVIKLMVISCFGPESPQAKKAGGLSIKFDVPQKPTAAEQADMGAKFSTTLQQLVASDIPLDMAVGMCLKFFPGIKIEKEYLDRISQVPPVEGGGIEQVLGLKF